MIQVVSDLEQICAQSSHSLMAAAPWSPSVLIYTALSAQCSSQPETAAPQVWMVARSFLMQAPGLAQFVRFLVMPSMRCKQNRRSHMLSATQSARHT